MAIKQKICIDYGMHEAIETTINTKMTAFGKTYWFTKFIPWNTIVSDKPEIAQMATKSS
jgi:hypothetical protein